MVSCNPAHKVDAAADNTKKEDPAKKTDPVPAPNYDGTYTLKMSDARVINCKDGDKESTPQDAAKIKDVVIPTEITCTIKSGKGTCESLDPTDAEKTKKIGWAGVSKGEALEITTDKLSDYLKNKIKEEMEIASITKPKMVVVPNINWNLKKATATLTYTVAEEGKEAQSFCTEITPVTVTKK